MSESNIQIAAELEQFFPREDLDPALVPYLCEGALGPMVSHPLVVSLTAVPELYGRINQLYKYNRQRADNALAERKWETYVWTHERPYRVAALKDLLRRRKLDWRSRRFAKLCADVWVDSENIPEYLRFWRRAFAVQNGEHWMTKEDLFAFKLLPDMIEIWRGECDDGGVSWTRSEKTARWFAHRQVNGSTGIVTRGVVARHNVFAHLTGRGESEIIVADRRMVVKQRHV